jgi:protease-4
LAQGRVWTGRQAQERGLVDELGGLSRAIALAKEHVGIDAEEEVQLIVYPRPKSLFELLNEGFTVMQAAARLGWLPVSPQALEAVSAPLRMFRSGEPLALMPSVFVF